MTNQPANGERPLPEDIADLVCCWVIDFLNVNGLQFWDEGPCVESMKQRMAPFLEYQAKLQKQLSDQADEISMLNAEAEMWQERAEIAERGVGRVTERLAAAETIIKLQGKGDFPPRVYFGQSNDGKWFADHDDEDGNRVALMRDETCPMYWNDWYAAYLAAVAAGWLPNPKEADRE